MQVVGTEVNGVPTLWTPGEGPLQAGLVFRVGRPDESLARGGLTHLIQHCVTTDVAHSPGTVTTFATRGSAADICAYFDTLCASLRDIPAERVDAAKAVVRAEREATPATVADQLPGRRYGPSGYGLASYPEYGLDAITVDDLRAWSSTRFTRGNAALWLVGGPPPDGLRLDLPDGPRQAVPAAVLALPRVPAYLPMEIDGIAFDSVMPRSTSLQVYAAVLQRRLRTTVNLAHAVRVFCEPTDPLTATVTAMAAALPELRDRVVGPFLDVLTDLAIGGASDEELRSVRSAADEELTGPIAAVTFLRSAAANLLTSAAQTSLAEYRADLDRLTPDDVRVIARDALAAGLIVLPTGQTVGRAGFTAAPSSSTTQVTGPEYELVNAEDPRRLVIGTDGVSVVHAPGIITVSYADCSLVAYGDGGRLLFGPDGLSIEVEPTLWGLPPEVVAAMDAQVPAARTALLEARPADQIPQPPPPRGLRRLISAFGG